MEPLEREHSVGMIKEGKLFSPFYTMTRSYTLFEEGEMKTWLKIKKM